MSSISINLQAVRQQIVHAAQMADRSFTEILLLAVSKNFDAEAVLEAVAAGQTAFGENYVQEALDKIAAVERLSPGLVLQWHFIGPMQSNKTRQIAEHFAWAHSVDRLKIAERLSEQRPAHLPPLNICLQINISEKQTKSGMHISQAAELAQQVKSLPNLRLRGLMAIPEPTETLELQRSAYRPIRLLQEQLNQQGFNLDTLSMGMSGDMEAAILEGSTIVRVGTAIFGKRNYA
ncbi:pyridoxal phosphate enzyme (YggS family) [Oxalobacteraceae bacterium GrIS 2.11]